MKKNLHAKTAVVVILSVLLPLSCSLESSETRTEDQQPRETGQAHKNPSSTTPPAATGRSAEEAGRPRDFLVPVAHLSSLRESVGAEELSGVRDLAVPAEIQDTAGGLLDRPDLRRFDSAEAVVDHVSTDPDAVGVVPWDAVEPRVKALAVEGEALLEPGESDLSDYPLRPEKGTGPEPERLRRIVIGGDVVLDRGQNYMVIQQGAGIDFPMDGGYAAITGRTPGPNPYSPSETIHEFTASRTGQAGVVREYLSGADLTLANLENPIVEGAVYHPEEPSFTGDLRLMPVLKQAGMDGVTLGNNHVLDAGTAGLEETLGHLDAAGIARAGAGTDLAAAREPMIFNLGETKVGVLSYLGIPGYDWAWATETAPGTAPLEEDVIREDIERLRPRVDVLVVMPHWGREYLVDPEPGQVDLAHAAVDAGADLVVGGHAHVPKGVEMYEGSPVFYGVGNFLLDQSWSEETSTGVFAEITLYGDRIIQTETVPFVLLDYAQPNFLLPDAGGDRTLRKIHAASRGPEFEADARR